MPASRRRGDRWKDTLAQIRDRGGSIEVTVERRSKGDGFRTDPGETVRTPPSDLLWRVRVRDTSDERIVVDLPSALGRTIEIKAGTRLVCVMSVGQNRWIFQSEVLSAGDGPGGALTMVSPTRVERATRRTQERVSTTSINLPAVSCWQLRDPATAVTAQAASRNRINELLSKPPADRAPLTDDQIEAHADLAPELGPAFQAQLANIGGGGIGLRVDADNASLVESSRMYWTRLDLRPDIPAPVELIARIAHTHLDSQQNVYAGMAFEFGLDPAHRPFVADIIERYMRSAAQG